MRMSVFRQGRPTTQLDHLAAIKLATEEHDLDLISWAHLNGKAVLTALERVACIIKPLESGDEGMSFDSLYDTAVTLRDFRRMREHKVQSPEAIGPSLYETVLVCEVEFNPRVRIQFKALDDKSAKETIQVLIDTTEFREQLVREMVLQICNSDDVRWVTAGYLKVDDVAPAADPDWMVVPSER
jgi:hypothetical protein